jgi:protein-tyrosine phosphatase
MADILAVCTGNVCRSPLAEAFLRSALRHRFGDRAPSVASAGTAGWAGHGAQPYSVTAAAERGADVSKHAARVLDAAMVREAALVVAMGTDHRDAVARMVPEARSRTFTLKELVRLLEAHPGDPNLLLEPRERLAEEVGRADAHRPHGLRRHPRDQDVADPLGMSLETYRAVAWELDEWCRRLADGLYGRADAPTPAGGTGSA